MNRLYFAYGSNLNREQMAQRCHDAIPVGRATVKGWRREFHCVLTIVENEKESVEGGLWQISSRDEKALDRYEGWPHLYRKERLIARIGKHRIEAMTYIMNGGELSPPSVPYFCVCATGMMQWDIEPAKLLRDYYRAVAATWDDMPGEIRVNE